MFCQELAATLARDAQPKLQAAGVDLVCVGIGTVETAQKFCDHVGFPRELLYADPENAGYDALCLTKGLAPTFFNPETPLAILRRLQQDGAADLVSATARWRPWLPPKSDQGLQQGGAFVFDGPDLLYSHYDPSTGAHAELADVLGAALVR